MREREGGREGGRKGREGGRERGTVGGREREENKGWREERKGEKAEVRQILSLYFMFTKHTTLAIDTSM